MKYSIFGFEARANSPCDEIVKIIANDNEILCRSYFDESSVIPIFKYLSEHIKTPDCEEFCSLAIIGLVDYMISKQIPLRDSLMELFFHAVEKDPLSKYEERQTVINKLRKSIVSVIDEEGALYV
ncbi:hypothetical protein [Photobacterium kishitanii]|uniref:Uncharacterized protein n=1 Tax=Photobacterium kishitanii TaxID=318456 RepID=A0A2T3KMX0_9GAMM|nr:hypothetical protein [Photobacterium kishitanii]PSV01157.1 hypothetical protein C9J27_03800 [Photobacterium kishitanii]